MNKSDTTSKEYLLAEIDDLADEFSEIDENGLHSERWCGIMDAKQIVINAPFVSDRPQGEWIESFKPITVKQGYIWKTKLTHDGWSCSKCSEVVEKRYPNCPYCLARMKGADDETEISCSHRF